MPELVPTAPEFKALEERVAKLEGSTCPPDTDDYTDPAIWELAFEEDFDNGVEVWSYWEDEPAGRWKTFFYFGDRVLNSNGERQYYMDPWYKGDGGYKGGQAFGIDPFHCVDSAVHITAEHSDPEKADHYWGYPYTSGLLTTEHSFSQTYGRFVAKMKMPAGKGLWPAFWLLPVDKTWPPEIDVVEFFGAPNSRGEGGVTKIHCGGHSMNGEQSYGSWIETGIDLTKEAHVYAVEWDAQSVRYFLDDRLVMTEPTKPDFHKPMYILLNLAVGGNWAEEPDENTEFPAALAVEFVRAYRRRTRSYTRRLPQYKEQGYAPHKERKEDQESDAGPLREEEG